MLRYIAIGASLAVSVALVAFLLGSWFPLLPAPVLAVILFLCPSHVFFVATAACEPFDACTFRMLGWVVAANVLLYSVLAIVLWLTQQRRQAARLVMFAAVAVASAWWASQWV
jgi:hypothetical protein